MLYSALVDTIKKLTRTRMKQAKQRGEMVVPSSYSRGVVYGIVKRMTEAQNEVMEEVRRTSKTALCPVDWSEKAKAAAYAAWNKRGSKGPLNARKSPQWDVQSAARGYRDGRKVEVPGEHAAITGRLALAERGES